MLASTLVTLSSIAMASAVALPRELAAVSALPDTFASLKGCPTPQYSCENTTAITNTCCSSTPGGLILLTQFWNTYTNMEQHGQLLPKDNWGIHGLWPDNCDGTYESYCDLSRQYDPAPSPNKTNDGTPLEPWSGETATDILKRFGRHDLLNYLEGYWVSRGEKSEVLWAHEFSKHATCMSTFDTACYPNYAVGADFVDYVLATVRAHKMYPSFQILAASGIVPSNTTTYSLADLESAYVAQVGVSPYFGCARDEVGERTVLTEIWVNAHVLGTPQYGQYKGVDSPAPSSCTNVTGAIHYYERTPSSEVSKTN